MAAMVKTFDDYEWFYLDQEFSGLEASDDEGRTKNRVGPFSTQEMGDFYSEGA